MIKEQQIRKYFKEAKKYFIGSEYVKLKFVDDKFEEEQYKKNGFGATAEFITEKNLIKVFKYSLKRKCITHNDWKAMGIHELTHWHFRSRNFQECHNKVFAAKLLSLYKKEFTKKEMLQVLKSEKWQLWKEYKWPVFETETIPALKVCKKYNLI